MIASSSIDSTVDFGSFGPVGRSATELRFFHLATGLLVDPVVLGQSAQALLTMLYRSTDRFWLAGEFGVPTKCRKKTLYYNASARISAPIDVSRSRIAG